MNDVSGSGSDWGQLCGMVMMMTLATNNGGEVL